MARKRRIITAAGALALLAATLTALAVFYRDPPEVAGIVHHGHEEVGRRDDAGVLVHLPDRGVVSGLGADQKLGEGLRRRHARQQVLQHGRRELASAAAAMGEAGQLHGESVHDRLR